MFQVRVIESLEPSPAENALTYGQLVGYFSQGRERSYQSCPNKYLSFDLPLAEAIDFGQVFVILKRTLQEPEFPEIKIYGHRNEGNFLNISQSMICVSDLLDLRVARVQYDTLVKTPIYRPAPEYREENCIDADLTTNCKSSDIEHPEHPSAIKLELQGPSDYEIKSVTIYSPIEDQSHQPDGHRFKVQA